MKRIRLTVDLLVGDSEVSAEQIGNSLFCCQDDLTGGCTIYAEIDDPDCADESLIRGMSYVCHKIIDADAPECAASVEQRRYVDEDYGLLIFKGEFSGDEKDLLTKYTGSIGSAFVIRESIAEEYPAPKHFFIAPLNKSPHLFCTAYCSLREALDELKTNYGRFLPEDFNYESRLVHYIGICEDSTEKSPAGCDERSVANDPN